MKFCPVVPEICRGQVHVPRKERKEEEKKKIIIRNGAKTISLQTLFGRLNYSVVSKEKFWSDKNKILILKFHMEK